MPGTDQLQKVVLSFGGGWATDFGPSFIAAAQGNNLTVPYFMRADNVTYELDGSPHKIGGSQVLNANATAGAIAGLYDFWLQGTAGTETQKRVIFEGTRIAKDDVDGVWDTLTSAQENAKEPSFETFDALCIMATDSTVDVPRSWDGTAASTSALAGSPPNFAFSRAHKNRLWAAGNAALPSRLYYTVSLDPEDWTGSGSGSIDIDPDDGDRITGLISHRNELIVFKGPNRLSIHRITGSAPTGTDAFARVPFVVGVGSFNHNSIFRINDDIVFASPRGLHSLAATAAYGDYVEAFLSRPILQFYQDELNHNVLTRMWGVNYQAKGLAVWNAPRSGGSVYNNYLVYDYRFQPGRWASWGVNSTYVNPNCLAIVQIPSTRRHRLFCGTTAGYVHELDRAVRSTGVVGSGSGTAYTGDVLTPFLNFGTSAIGKNAHRGFWSLLPKGAFNFTFSYTRDNLAAQEVTIPQGGGDTLA